MIIQRIFKLVCVYFSSICMLGGGLHWAFFFTITAQVVSFDVYALDQLKAELDAKYQLDTPKNVDGTDLYQKLINNKDKGPISTKDIEVEILSRPVGAGSTVDTSQYNEIDFHQEFEKYMGEGITSGTPKAPTMTDGNIDVEYYEKAGATLTRDEDGHLIVNDVPESERGEKITSIKSNEVFTNQQQRSDESFNAPSNYGDETAFKDDLKVQYDKASDGKTMNSEAYRAILKSNVDNPAPKISSNSYFLAETNNAISDAKNGEGIWDQSCVDKTTTETEQRNIPVWEPKICQRPNHQNNDFCEVTRVLEKQSDLVKVDFQARFAYSWGNSLRVSVNFSEGTSQPISPSDPEMISGTVEYAEDIDSLDYAFFCGATTSNVRFIEASNWAGSPLADKRDTSIETTIIQEPSCANGLVGIFKVRDTRSSGDKAYDLTGDFSFQIQTSDYKEVYTESPAGCASSVGWKPGPYPCEGDNCYDSGYEKNSFCTFDQWEVVDQGVAGYPQWVIETLKPLYSEDPNPVALYGGDADGEGEYHVGTWKINAENYSCDPLKGNEYCVQVLNAETQSFQEQCYNYNEFTELDGSCGQYENNSRCEKTGDSCAEGWYDEVNDICFMYSNDYRCDVSTPFEITKTKTTNVCAGMLPCMGDDCAYGDEETSDDFEKAVLMGSIAQTVDDDSTCASEDPATCEIFPGELEYCSWEVSGMGNNCCEAPAGVNYLEMAAVGYKMMQSETFKNVSSSLSGGVTDQIGGLYTDFTSMLVEGWNSGATAVVDFASSVMGDPEFMQGVADTFQIGAGQAAGKGVVAGLMHQMQQQVFSYLNDLLPDALADMLFQEATDEMVEKGTAEVGETLLSDGASQFLSILSFVGMLYTIYNVVMLLANLLTQCDENEQDMGVKLAQKQCFAVGNKYCAKKVLGVCYLRRQDWCCYSSMLSRIIADQGSKQLGKDMSSCPGFTIAEFGQIDFDRLDLSEWLSTMYEADILSTSGYDIERLTGTGRMFGNVSCEGSDDPECTEKERKNAEERAGEQFTGDASDTANQLKETFDPEQIDCSVYPRPMICELNGN
jgi:conjugal transfer mating pair stabilization protein TraN